MQTRSTWSQNVFDAILNEYIQVTPRDLATVLNTKAFYIARAATRFTLKAGRDKIQNELGKIVTVGRISKKGNIYYRKTLNLTMGERTEGPLAALIINKRLGRHHKEGLYGREMRRAIMALIGIRKRSNAFIASGWIDSIKLLAPLAAPIGKRPEMASSSEMQRYGVPKGGAVPATASSLTVIITNNAVAKRDHKDATGVYGSRGLAMAFEDEANSMLQYIEQHGWGPSSKKANEKLSH